MAKTYSLRLAGTSNYQDAVRGCATGTQLRLFREPDNPYDDKAIAAARIDGATVGYVPQAGWLARAVYRDGSGVSARVLRVDGQDREQLGLLIEVELGDGPLAERAFKPG